MKTGSTKKTVTHRCPVCRKEWIKHDGIIDTCSKLEMARSALKVIQTWASFNDGDYLDAYDVLDLTRRTLKKIM